MDVLGDVLLVIGAGFGLIAAIGVQRFPDAYSRMHAAAKAPTLGLILVAIGAGLRIGTLFAAGTLALVVILQLLTAPVSTHVIARAVHLRIRVPQDGVDELQRDEHAGEHPSFDGVGEGDDADGDTG